MSKKIKVSISIIISITIITVICILGYFYMPICPDVDKRINRTTEFTLFIKPVNTHRMGATPYAYTILTNSKEIPPKYKKLVIEFLRGAKTLDTVTETMYGEYIHSSPNGNVFIECENGVTFFINDIDATYLNRNTMTDFNIEYQSDFTKWYDELREALYRDFQGVTDEEYFSHEPFRP